VLGAGGAARAAVLGPLREGARVTIVNRTRGRAEHLALEMTEKGHRLDVRSVEEAGALEWDVLVNATSVGMHPDLEATPYPAEGIRPGGLVFDTVYRPPETRLLREAAAAGAGTLDGLSMFVEQGAAQFALWTGEPAPREAMREALAEALRREA